jgi:hypothetical protein
MRGVGFAVGLHGNGIGVGVLYEKHACMCMYVRVLTQGSGVGCE